MSLRHSTKTTPVATSSGGYGSSQNPYSPASQRGRADPSQPNSDAGLIDQSTSGGPIGKELDDAKQGRDGEARRNFEHEVQRDFAHGSQGLNPYGKHVDNREQAGNMLADKYNDARGKQFESGGAASLEGDAGMI